MISFIHIFFLVFLTHYVRGAPFSESSEVCLDKNVVVLTFDDGPSQNTKRIVDILNQNNVSATFFINGLKVINDENMLETIHYIHKYNHTLATHTFSHPALEMLNDFNIMRELFDNELVFRMILNKRPRFFRPPYFSYNDNIQSTIENVFGYTLVPANLDTKDWKTPDIASILLEFSKAFEGPSTSFITLQHEQVDASISALDEIIKYIKSKNFRIISLSECLGLSPYQSDNVYGPNLINGISPN
jgi:peptidoglycan/xylan/chitin deacetylase (PgdA/CDA1 family)